MHRHTGAKNADIRLLSLIAVLVFSPAARPAGPANTALERTLAPRTAGPSAIFWRDPTDLKSRNLFYGIGGKRDAPPPAGYTFVKEDRTGSSPKFVVKDANGVRWKVKLGPEVRGEIAATRIVWAAGFFTDEDYYLPEIHVKNMPSLKRGRELVYSGGVIKDVRMEREIEDQKKVGSWKWKTQGAFGRRAFNGLKIVMALINDWDLKDDNTAIYKRQNAGQTEYIYVVSDLGASFGPTHLERAKTKANLAAYESSEFIRTVGREHVSFATPGAPTIYLLVNPPQYAERRGLMSLARDIPRSDAHWMGQLLAGLSAQQIRDAFRAGGFSPSDTEAFVHVLEQRIELLREL